jgi:hypothetical protein
MRIPRPGFQVLFLYAVYYAVEVKKVAPWNLILDLNVYFATDHKLCDLGQVT